MQGSTSGCDKLGVARLLGTLISFPGLSSRIIHIAWVICTRLFFFFVCGFVCYRTLFPEGRAWISAIISFFSLGRKRKWLRHVFDRGLIISRVTRQQKEVTPGERERQQRSFPIRSRNNYFVSIAEGDFPKILCCPFRLINAVIYGMTGGAAAAAAAADESAFQFFISVRENHGHSIPSEIGPRKLFNCFWFRFSGPFRP